MDAVRRGLMIAQDSGNRGIESFQAESLAELETKYGDPLAALEYLTLAIRNYHESGNVTIMRSPSRCWPRFFTGSDTMKLRPLSPVSQSTP